MKRRHLPPVLVLLLALSLLSLPFRRRLFLPRGPSQYYAGGDALLRRLAAADAGGDQVRAEAAALLANASVSSFPSIGNRYRLLYLRLPYHTNATSAPRQRAVSRLRVPFETVPDDGALLAAFRASLRSFLLARRQLRRRGGDAGVAMGGIGDLLGRHPRRERFPTCAVVGNSGILLGSGRGAQIDAHDLVVRLNNARVAGYAADVGAKTSLSFVNSNILHRCAVRSAVAAGGCACHPSTTSPFPLLVTNARLDVLCARIANYYSMRRFVATTGEPANNWT